MAHLLNIKVNDNCPNADFVRNYYREKIAATSYDGDSGVDVIMPQDFVFKANTMIKCNLGISCEFIPDQSNPGEYGAFFLMPRSSISSTPLFMVNSVGLIDSGYRGELGAPLRCAPDPNFITGDDEYVVKMGTRLFQLVAPDAKPIKIALVDSLSESQRGTRGFGSTNV